MIDVEELKQRLIDSDLSPKDLRIALDIIADMLNKS